MDERNVINGMAAVALSEFLGFLHPLRFFLLAGAVLILADLRFGIEAAKARKEKIRKSRRGGVRLTRWLTIYAGYYWRVL